MSVEVGDAAPDFTLKDQDNNEVTLSSFRSAKNVTLVFYPFTFSGICEGELCLLRDDLNRFEAADTQVLAISCDSRHSQRVWAEQNGYGFPVLSDHWPHGAVARSYGVFNDDVGAATRTTFVIDKDGWVVARFGTPDLATARAMEDYENAISALA
jgi:peroxiredoxin